MVNVASWPATARAEPQPSTVHRHGSAEDCTQASAAHWPQKDVPSEKRQLPWPCRLPHSQAPAHERTFAGAYVGAAPHSCPVPATGSGLVWSSRDS